MEHSKLTWEDVSMDNMFGDIMRNIFLLQMKEE